MKKTSFVVVLAALLCLSAKAADNAPPNSGSQDVPTFSIPFWEGWGYDPWYGGYGRASTYAEGLLNGWGNYWRGVGEYNFWSAQAAAEQEMARKLYLENRAKELATRYELRRIREEARANQPRPTQQDATRLAQQNAPKRLTQAEFDPATGKIHWPELLRQDVFAVERTELDKLFAERSPGSVGVGSAMYHRATNLIAAMDEKLKPQVNTLSPSEYITAKKFLAGLKMEAHGPPVMRVVLLPAAEPEPPTPQPSAPR